MNNVFEIDWKTGELKAIKADAKSDYKRGRVLYTDFYGTKWVITENMGVTQKCEAYGAKYKTIQMEEFYYNDKFAYTIGDKDGVGIRTYALDEVLTESEVVEIEEKANAKLESDKIAQDARKIENDALLEKGKAIAAKYIPADAVALIVAELWEDQSDSQTDYFGGTTREIVILGYSKTKRENFNEMRKFAALIPETADLAIKPIIDRQGREKTEENKDYWEAADEYRQNYSMGGGYFLTNGHRYSGWKVSKKQIWNGLNNCDYIDIAKRNVLQESKPKKAPKQAMACESSDNGVVIGEYKGNATIQLPCGSRGFTFGLAKAKAILEHYESIKAFVDSQ